MSPDTRPSVACLSGRRVVDVLDSLGAHTVLLDDPTPLESAARVDVPLDLDLGDWIAVESALRAQHAARPLDGIFTVYDAHLPLASYLAARIGVRGLGLPAALACHDMARLRMTLDAGGVRTPVSLSVADPADARAAARRLGLPVVIRRTVGRGRLLCRDLDEVKRASDLLGPAALLVERFTEGLEYAVQSLTVNGVTEVVCVLAQHTDPGPAQVETGYDHPSGLVPAQEAELKEFCVRALAVLGFDHGVSHMRVTLTDEGPECVDVAARPPGGQLCAAVERVSGIDLTRAAAEIVLGRPVTRGAPTAGRVLYRCVHFDGPGRISYDPRGLAAPGVWLDVEPGDSVRTVDDPEGGTYGRIVVYGDDPAELHSTYDSLKASLRLLVEPDIR
ncbi:MULTISPECIES: ATP-grasp domain-containing protein [Streptomyces]|uniref:ATP-grasp domain-containing protein n=1 Tax=Streptomyces TaxID=1883 RepID=UPI000F1F5CE5|nr:ATP-grasp domain-containing protein [Streptomyces sp. CBMAI 2042]RLV64723.1 phosphoribosylglycinamide synthetase, ATP-grasp (A) domain protein [Streptomyces sp. CBMAI 2042]